MRSILSRFFASTDHVRLLVEQYGPGDPLLLGEGVDTVHPWGVHHLEGYTLELTAASSHLDGRARVV
jgi:hypothetical protein